MFQLIRAFQKQSNVCCAFRNVQRVIVCKPSIAHLSSEAKAKNVEDFTRNGAKVSRSFKPKIHTEDSENDLQYSDQISDQKEVKEKAKERVNIIRQFENFSCTDDYIKSIESGTPTTAVQVFIYLTRKNLKSPPVLKVIASKLCDTPEKILTLKQCVDVLYCCSILSYKEENLVTKIASEVLKLSFDGEARKFSPLILRSLGSLKLKDCELIDALLKNILQYPSPTKVKDLLTSLMTLSIIDFKSYYLPTILKELGDLETHDFSVTKQYLDFVWASVILNELNEKHISCVLSKTFIEALRTFGGVHGGSEAINLKLQNINAAAENLVPNYSGPFLSKIFSRPLASQAKTKYLCEVVDGLSHIFPKTRYLRTSKDTKNGFLVDIEFMVDPKTGEPVPTAKIKGDKVALMLLDFNDYCLGKEKTITGINVFKHRILKSMGYKVITISYKDFNKNLTLAEKIKYLKEKIKIFSDNKIECN